MSTATSHRVSSSSSSQIIPELSCNSQNCWKGLPRILRYNFFKYRMHHRITICLLNIWLSSNIGCTPVDIQIAWLHEVKEIITTKRPWPSGACPITDPRARSVSANKSAALVEDTQQSISINHLKTFNLQKSKQKTLCNFLQQTLVNWCCVWIHSTIRPLPSEIHFWSSSSHTPGVGIMWPEKLPQNVNLILQQVNMVKWWNNKNWEKIKWRKPCIKFKVYIYLMIFHACLYGITCWGIVFHHCSNLLRLHRLHQRPPVYWHKICILT